MSAEGTRRAIVAAFLANLGIAISKFVAFLVTGSASMLAESIHSVADTGNQGLLFLGGKRARKAPTAEHPFGFGTERYFWAFIVALVLFTLGAMFAMYEGIQKLIDPHELDSPIWAFGVLGVAIVLEGWSLRTAHHEAKPSRGKRSVVVVHPHHQEPRAAGRAARGHRRADRPRVRARSGSRLAEITGNARWDALGSIGIGLLLGVIAVVLAIEMKSLLIGEAVVTRGRRGHPRRDPRRPRGCTHHPPAHVSTSDPTTSCSPPSSSSRAPRRPRSPTRSTPSKSRVRASTPIVRLIFLEPDFYDPSRAESEEVTDDRTPPKRSSASTRRSTTTTSTR